MYRHHRTRPDELLDADWSSTSAGIVKHLLDGLIPAVFTAATGGHRPRTPAQTAAAHRHLSFLAGQLHRHSTYDLAWWQLHQALSHGALRLMGGIVVGPMVGLVAALVFGLAAGPAAGLNGGIVLGLVGGITVALASGSRRPHVPRKVQIKARSLILALVCGLVFGLADGLTMGLWAGLAGGLADGLADETDNDGQHAISPMMLLREDRAATLAVGLTGGLTVGLAGGLAAGLTVGLTAGIAIGLGDGAKNAWQRFLLTRVLLAVQGHTPGRLMAFLQEAHDRGVLRQAGGFYQFRHAHLQDRLALTRPD